MNKKFKRLLIYILTIFQCLKYIPIFFILKFKLGGNFLKDECINWIKIIPCEYNLRKFPGNSNLKKFLILFRFYREFRSYLYFKCNWSEFNIFYQMFRPMNACYISSTANIGKGFVIHHGHSTEINCESMGNNCEVWQNVTIGVGKPGIRNPKKPRIGSNVKICAGAIVVGNIEIKDNVTIGAGTVVVKDVPSNCIVVGNPARIIKTNI